MSASPAVCQTVWRLRRETSTWAKTCRMFWKQWAEVNLLFAAKNIIIIIVIIIFIVILRFISAPHWNSFDHLKLLLESRKQKWCSRFALTHLDSQYRLYRNQERRCLTASHFSAVSQQRTATQVHTPPKVPFQFRRFALDASSVLIANKLTSVFSKCKCPVNKVRS